MSLASVITQNDMGQPRVQFQRILVATDFSPGAREALDYALAIGRQFQTEIFLVHVIPTTALRYITPEASEETSRQAEALAAQEMKKLVAEAGCAGQVQEEILFSGAVWPGLQGFVKKNAVDLIVLGTHGRSPVKARLLGPVAEEIFRLAEQPVLTVGPVPETSMEKLGGIRRILYATNFKPHAERAAGYAYALEREQGAQLTVLHVVEGQGTAAKEGLEIVQEFLVRRMRKGIPPDCVGKCEPDFAVRFGEPARQILHLAREQQADLIVVGMRSGVNAPGLLPSAVAYELACQSPCPVLTVRH